MKKVVSIGEALIDFIPNQKGVDLKDVTGFDRVAGGAPANVAAVVAKLGGNANFISKLGEDAFGDYIIETLKNAGVNTEYVLRTDKANTGLAFVSLKEDGNRDFSFYRNPSADMLLEENEIKEEWLDNSHSLHFCSVDLIESPMKYAHKKAIEIASKKGVLISFDPNVRLPLWKTEEECRSAILEFLPLANILKISDEEVEFITGECDIEKALDKLFVGNVELVLYTKGKDGVDAYTKKVKGNCDGIKVNAIDTTGAGDSYIGSFLYSLLEDDLTLEDIKELKEEKLNRYLTFSNYYAARSTTIKGAINSYGNKDDVNEFIKNK